MAAGRTTFTKRQRERVRDRRKQEKKERRARRQAEKPDGDAHPDGVDPDIAGIVPGPQPIPWDAESDGGDPG